MSDGTDIICKRAGNARIDMGGILADVPLPELRFGGGGSFALPNGVPEENDLFAERKRKAWDKSVEARCDFQRKVRLTRRAGVFFISIWQKSLYGRTLTEIKEDDSMVDVFAANTAELIRLVVGRCLDLGGWAVCTTPRRRHKMRNFASLIAEKLADSLSLPFYDNAALCRSKQRVGAVFSANNIPMERNVLLFDDFVTTGSTIGSMYRLLAEHGKNVLIFTGINNAM